MTFTTTLVKLVLVYFALYAPLVTIVSVFDGMRFSVLAAFFCGFAVLDDFFFGFAVSNIP